VLDIDLRPAGIRCRVTGVKRARMVTRCLRNSASTALSALLALVYVEFASVRVKERADRYLEELRRLTIRASDISRATRRTAERRVTQEKAYERARLLGTLLHQLDTSSTGGVSFSELRAQGGTVMLRGEVDDVATLRKLANDLSTQTKESTFTVESLKDAPVEGNRHISTFSARVSLVASAR